jgi:hypothetical protein
MPMGIVHFLRAEVAELVDALGSGSSGCTPVLVQIQSSAPFFKKNFFVAMGDQRFILSSPLLFGTVFSIILRLDRIE